MDVVSETRTQGPWTIVALEGELDLHTSPEVRDHVLGLIRDGADRVALEMSKVTFMDSSTLGALITCMKRAKERGGTVVLVGVEGSPLKVLNLTGLDRVFEVLASTEDLPDDR
ncbi:MAG TPA: STAS domain-containing protein [Actinomycetota bacterium]|jgi:anti-sigma B factor antagonist